MSGTADAGGVQPTSFWLADDGANVGQLLIDIGGEMRRHDPARALYLTLEAAQEALTDQRAAIEALRPLRAALERYGRALAAVRAEQARLRSIGYAGRTVDAPTFDVLLAERWAAQTERWAAQDEIDALALALVKEGQ